MEASLKTILDEVKEALGKISSLAQYESFKATILGSNGSFTQISKSIGKLSKEERPQAGQLINHYKKQIESLFAGKFSDLEEKAFAAKLGTLIDPSLPSPDLPLGCAHPLTIVREKINAIFQKVGFTIAEGPEIETEWFCFDALNTPLHHPARAEADTLYFPKKSTFKNVSQKANERYLIRTQTSTVQIRTLLEKKPPIRIIAPGRCCRRDTVDATHSANFHQVECLYVDKNVSLLDLKAILDFFIHELFGSAVKTRLRPSFFPFTEPSFELDFQSPSLGKLSNQWVEVLGCGLVDPAVFASVGLDPGEWSGYAFGGGIERIAMLLYGIDDIRYFYQNDIRFLKQFNSVT